MISTKALANHLYSYDPDAGRWLNPTSGNYVYQYGTDTLNEALTQEQLDWLPE